MLKYTAVQGKIVEASSWRVPIHVPSAVANHIVVAAFTAPPRPTMQALADTMPRGSNLTIICPEPIRKPKGKFNVNVLKGMLVPLCISLTAASENTWLQSGLSLLCEE